jgi:hypothetical protein
LSAKLLQARNALRQAERNYNQMLISEYPVGSYVKWVRGAGPHITDGTVIQHGYGGRMLVRRNSAVRPHWIYADDIARAAEFAATTRKAAA